MNLYQVSLALLFLCLFNAFISASNNPTDFTGDFSVNCGSSGTSAAQNGRIWHGDIKPKLSSLLQIKGLSTASSVMHKLIPANDPVPYKTARLSRSQFSYAFQVNPGQKIIRLHFNPAPYRGFKRFKDLFAVEAAPFTLLSNFSASLTAHALGVNSFVKEFVINMEESQEFSIVFTPASSELLDTYAFINGIEIISVPASLSYFHRGDIGIKVVGKSLVYVDNTTALEIIRRLNIKDDSVSSAGDIDDMFGMWETVPKRKASRINTVSWKISVDVGFKYLVRLHFSKLGFKMAEIGGVIFKVCINEMIADTSIDIIREKDDENSIPGYRDYMVMMKGSKQEGKRDLLICLQSNDEFLGGNGPLKGFEIIKLSNPDNSLASPNPMPVVQESSYRTIQNLLQVLGYKNVIASVPIAIFALVNTIIYTLQHIWEASKTEEENKPSARAERLCRRFSLAEIQLATRNFSDAHFIGKGGFGKVYKGHIDNGRETMAIKRLKSSSKQGAREFLTEIETLTELRHVNLVSLIGYCNENGEMILVYEYMAHGTLADHLYKFARNNGNSSSLTWEQRLNICIGAARGLDYLHTGQSFIHRDVKASNILLDENLRAKVSDFGLAKPLSRSELQSHVSTKVKGTFGYFDPNYLTTGKLTKKSDTYAFGVVLLEVLTGRPALDPIAAKDERMLTKWAQENISKGKVDHIVASNLKGKISKDSLKAFVGIAERCLDDEPKKRPTMTQVVLQLEIALEQQESSKSPVKMGEYPSTEVTRRNFAQLLKVEAMDAISDGKFNEAKYHLTEAIMWNPKSAILYANRASVFLKLGKPNDAIQDADAALLINPNFAKGYKARGMAREMLGLWEEAAHDLHVASKLDFDEEIGLVLKKVEPNANKIQGYRRKYEHLRKENELTKMQLEKRSFQDTEAASVLKDGQVIRIRSFSELKTKLNAAAKTPRRLAIIYFTATWCGPCRFISPVYSALAGKYPKVVFLKVDMDEATNAAAEWNVSNVPSFFFVKNGREVDILVGADQNSLETKIAQHAESIAF